MNANFFTRCIEILKSEVIFSSILFASPLLTLQTEKKTINFLHETLKKSIVQLKPSKWTATTTTSFQLFSTEFCYTLFYTWRVKLCASGGSRCLFAIAPLSIASWQLSVANRKNFTEESSLRFFISQQHMHWITYLFSEIDTVNNIDGCYVDIACFFYVYEHINFYDFFVFFGVNINYFMRGQHTLLYKLCKESPWMYVAF